MRLFEAPPRFLSAAYIATQDLAVELAGLPGATLVESTDDGPWQQRRFEVSVGDIAGVVRLVRFHDIMGMGCIHWMGPQRIELAYGMSPTVGLLPTDVLHAFATSADDAPTRLAALRTQTLLGDLWPTPRSARLAAGSVHHAVRDRDPLVRRFSPTAAFGTRLRTSVRELFKLRDTTRDDLTILEIDAHILEGRELHENELPGEALLPRALHLPCVDPFGLEGSLDMLPRYVPRSEVERSGPWACAAARSLGGRGAEARFVVHEPLDIGGVVVTGEDRAAFAYGLSRGVRLLPLEFVELMLRYGSIPSWRDHAAMGALWACCSPGAAAVGIDPELERLAASVTSDAVALAELRESLPGAWQVADALLTGLRAE